MRWGAVTSADPNRYQAPFWSRCRPSRPTSSSRCAARWRRRARTCCSPTTSASARPIEAGLVIQELLLRHRARTAVVVCPPSLALKWQDEMRDKFGLDFTIVNSDLMARGPPHATACTRTRSCCSRG